ncbi:MAG: nucleoside-diphosphate sugar epimerase/dehydratase [Oscillospiraceae bacterium]|nr:nucleoside-diphosphate sugar epimerase/dehydratase [Oscillospiraceae bacterium]
MKQNKMKKRAKPILILIMIAVDAFVVNLAGFAALFTRFEFEYFVLVASGFLDNFKSLMLISTAATILIFALFRLYSTVWAYAGVGELLRIITACILSVSAEMIYAFIFHIRMPRSYMLMKLLFFITAVCVIRFANRITRMLTSTTLKKQKRTMLIGAGRSGDVVVRELKNSVYSENKIVCIIDDDKMKQGRFLNGVKVVGGREKIVESCEKYNVEEIIVAMPTATALQKREIVNICQKTNCQIMTLPGIYQLANGEVDIQKIRKVDVEDLLGRDSIRINLDEISGYIKNKTVLVTGGGGSIGSELCRQISKYEPKELIIFDIYENNAYQIQQELRRSYPDLNLTVLIGSVRDRERVNDLFAKYRPNLVFHAAAHKHVPLMEDSPAEAIKNNVFGTFNVATAASEYGAEKMVLISTDKAVNPTNVMGASKRMCELIIEMMNDNSDTEFVAVRFGNVLGSNGSVIPLFKKQIEHGGPVTVTHKDIIRYFMTIPEAVSLVLQAGSYAKGGEIFVLDMGDPVRIDDLARNMIKLSGFEPDVDIKVEYTGLRPGEKLFEELLLNTEGIEKTPNDLIFIGHPSKVSKEDLLSHLDVLKNAEKMTQDELRNEIHSIVKEFNDENARVTA